MGGGGYHSEMYAEELEPKWLWRRHLGPAFEPLFLCSVCGICIGFASDACRICIDFVGFAFLGVSKTYGNITEATGFIGPHLLLL